MSAQDNISQQLFHGTDVALSVGDVIRPGNHRVAHASPSPLTAAGFAEMRTFHEPRNSNPDRPMFGTVYKVEPVDRAEFAKTDVEERARREKAKDVEESANPNYKFSKKGFRVTGIHSLVANSDDVIAHRNSLYKEKKAKEDAENERLWAEARENYYKSKKSGK